MKLLEHQGKALFREYGIPVPTGEVAATPEEAREIAARIGGTVVVKAQVLAGGRGKAGGVKIAGNPEEAAARAAEILGMRIKGIQVKRVLVAAAVGIRTEYYLALALDRSSRTVQCIASASGGIDIEEVARKDPGRIVRFPVDTEADPGRGIDEAALARVFPGPSLAAQARDILEAMRRFFADKDCSLVEINPLAETEGGRLVAVDAKVVFDDNGLFKHPELAPLSSPEEYSTDEVEAKAGGLSFVELDGTIGCVVNGAGLSMATMDLIGHFGGTPANFLDVGGSSNPEKVITALRIILRGPRVKAVLVNIFGGITRCDDIARGLLMARDRIRITVPLVIRLIGTNEAEGRALLRGAGIEAYEDLAEAVKAVVRKAGEGAAA